MESTLAHGPIDLTPIAEGLFISDWPETGGRARLEAEGIRLLLSMHWRRPPAVYHRLPFETVWLPTIDLPFTPMPLRSLRAGCWPRSRSWSAGRVCWPTACLAGTAVWRWVAAC